MNPLVFKDCFFFFFFFFFFRRETDFRFYACTEMPLWERGKARRGLGSQQDPGYLWGSPFSELELKALDFHGFHRSGVGGNLYTRPFFIRDLSIFRF